MKLYLLAGSQISKSVSSMAEIDNVTTNNVNINPRCKDVWTCDYRCNCRCTEHVFRLVGESEKY